MADEVFSGGVSVTGVEPGTTTIAIKSTTNPNISKKVPVTVKSRNLLAYGPASGNGLTVTVAQDGSLDFDSGTESVPLNKGVRWEFDVPEGIVGVPLILSYTGDVPGTLVIGIYANANSLGGVYQGKNNTVVTIPKGDHTRRAAHLAWRRHGRQRVGQPENPTRTREHRARVDETRCHKP